MCVDVLPRATMGRMRAAVIVVSDRVHSGEREDKSGPRARKLLADAGVEVGQEVVVPEGGEAVAREIDRALAGGVRLIVTTGGTGIGARNLTPEVTAERLGCRLTGLETQVLIEGLKSSPQAGLSRGLIGLTSRDERATLIVNAPSAPGAVSDSLGVVLPLLGSIFERFQ